MNIQIENKEGLNAILKLKIEKEDYEKRVEDVLKDYRKQANMPGFRPGMVPYGLIKKKFGKHVLVEEINKIVSESVSKHIYDEKLKILGDPLPNTEEQPFIDWDSQEEFEFVKEGIGVFSH